MRMVKELKSRLATWKNILWRPISAIWSGGLFVLAEIFNMVREELSPEVREKWRIVNMIPSWPWWIWTIIGLVGLLLITLEGAYRLIAKKEEEFKEHLNIVQTERDQLRKDLHKDEIFLPLKEVVQEFYDECRNRPLCNRFLEDNFKESRDKVWNMLAETFVEYIKITYYGKDSYSDKLREIIIATRDYGNIEFENEGSTLYIRSKSERYDEVSIKKEDVQTVITGMIRVFEESDQQGSGSDLTFIPLKDVLQQIYNECEADALYTETIADHKKIHKSRDDMLNWIADWYVTLIDTPIYGKDNYSTNLKQIPKAKISSGHFGFEGEATSLYANENNEKQYTHFSIKKSELRQAIDETKKLMFNLSG